MKAVAPSWNRHARLRAADAHPIGTVVYLNGVAASGKSTLARGLQVAWPTPWLHVGLDWLSGTMPDRFLGSGPEADLGARWVTGPDGRLLRVDPGPHGVRLLQGLPRLAAALARAGNDVIVDNVLLYPWRTRDGAIALDGVPPHLVEVRCPLEIAQARARARDGAAEIGMVDATYATTYAGDRYDLRIDTGTMEPEACVARLAAYLRSGETPTAFAALRAG
ncbi:MAG: AAA family ATPase [Trueperaceae bacterium]|nr:AAA family ATPase [Trueperaceae bacterium]